MSDTDESPEKSLSDTLAEESQRKPRPEGTPGLWPFLQLPRRLKAQFYAAIKNYPEDGVIAGDTVFEKVANTTALVADVEDALRIVARDSDVFRDWAKRATDEDVLGLFGWYMERHQVGEASPSPS